MSATPGLVMKRKIVANEVLDLAKEVVKTEDQKKIEEHCRKLHIDNYQTHVVEKRMRISIEHGLTKKGQAGSSMKCFPTYVTKLPTGKEKGKFMALDLGGTNFRIMVVQLQGDRKKEPITEPQQQFKVPEDIMKSEGTKLFDYIAEKISEFVKANNLQKEALPIGFTFSFPCSQDGLDSATLTKWVKGYDCPDSVGKDIGKELHEAIKKRSELKVKFVAILNDTTGTLMSCAWAEPRCRVGMIVGTGSNACYLEEASKVENFNGPKGKHKTVIVNTEWGAFGEYGELDFLLTPWDIKVDEESVHPGVHIYEKLMSGMYLGEIVRHVLQDLAQKKLVFKGIDCKRLSEKDSFETRHACEVEHDPIGSFDRCRKALKEVLQIKTDVPEADCYAVRFVCEEITRRACMLLGAGLAAILRKMDYKDVVIAVDGTLFRKHPLFPIMMQKKISQLMGIEYQFEMVLSEDGSGIGAAIVAAAESNNS